MFRNTDVGGGILLAGMITTLLSVLVCIAFAAADVRPSDIAYAGVLVGLVLFFIGAFSGMPE